MKRKLSRALALLVLFSMLTGIIALAGERNEPSNNNAGSSTEARNEAVGVGSSTGDGSGKGSYAAEYYTLRMFLTRLDNEDFSSDTSSDSLKSHIADYCTKYYIACQPDQGALYWNGRFNIKGKSFSIPSNKLSSPAYNGGSVVWCNESAYEYSNCAIILDKILADGATYGNHAPGLTVPYLLTENDGLAINSEDGIPNRVASELGKLDTINSAYLNEYMLTTAVGKPTAHPIVIGIEVVGHADMGKRGWASCADMCRSAGGDAAYQKFLTTNIKDKHLSYLDNTICDTDVAIGEICNFSATKGNASVPPMAYTLRMFNTTWKSGTPKKSGLASTAATRFAEAAHMMGTDPINGILGCTIASLPPLVCPSDNPPPPPPGDDDHDHKHVHPDGEYTWHIDAEGATLTTSGHREDQVVKLPGSPTSTITKAISVGTLNLYQDNYHEWQNWITGLHTDKVRVTIKRYHLGQSSFTTNINTIRSNGSSTTGLGLCTFQKQDGS